jgi:hypothetical protein
MNDNWDAINPMLNLCHTTGATSARRYRCPHAGPDPVLEEAADHHGLARAWRLLTYVHMTATPSGMAAGAAQQTIRHAEQAGDELMASAARTGAAQGLPDASAAKGAVVSARRVAMLAADLQHEVVGAA